VSGLDRDPLDSAGVAYERIVGFVALEVGSGYRFVLTPVEIVATRGEPAAVVPVRKWDEGLFR